MGLSWSILVVDDAEDVHQITKLALKRKSWRNRRLSLFHAASAKEARELLAAAPAPPHCALVDVVMETEHAGLELCDYIRATQPRSTRIILRTGQPGAAPPERVLNDYDIDYYLAKAEVTEDKLYATIRACLRSSQDISTLLALTAQMQSMALGLQSPAATPESLRATLVESLRFLEDKYDARLAFIHDVRAGSGVGGEAGEYSAALARAYAKEAPPRVLHRGEDFGLPGSYLVLVGSLDPTSAREATVSARIKSWFKNMLEETGAGALAGVIVRLSEPGPLPRVRDELLQELNLFLTNWAIAHRTLTLQDRLVRERMDLVRGERQL